MIHLKTYKLFESSGVAEATLIYNQFLIDEYFKCFEEFIEENLPKPQVKDRSYSKTKTYTQQDLSKFIENDLWPKFPISEMTITYTLNVMTDDDFNKKYPGTSQRKKFIGTGACYNIGEEEGSSLKPAIDDRSDVTISLGLEIGAVICDSFKEVDDLSVEIESSITHELNHGYEGWNRLKKNKGQVSTELTYALDVNRAKIRKDIWKVWYDEIGFFIYWSEPWEINAMVQDAWPYVRRYDVNQMKEKAPSWRFSSKMLAYKSTIFKQKMIDKIKSVYPDADAEMILKKMKNGLANELIANRKEAGESKEDKPTLAGEAIKKMSVDKFLKFIEGRINRAGNKIQKNIIRLYSLKNKY